MVKQQKHFYEFGAFRLDTVNRVLLRDGQVVPLKRKALETLVILVEHNGEVLDKERMMNRLWPDSFVEESNLTQNIYMLRKALDDGSHEHQYIATIPGRGYRFSAEIRELGDERDEMVIETRTVSRLVITQEGSTSQEIVARPRDPAMGAIEQASSKPSRVTGKMLAALGRNKKSVLLIMPLVIVAIAAIVYYRSRQLALPPEPSPPPSRVVPFTSYPGNESEPAFSLDGRQIAFVWDGGSENSDIYVKLLDVGKPLRLTTDPAMDHGPIWSPDGRYIAFLRRQSLGIETILLIPALGGPERKLGQVVDGLDWSPDGQDLAVVDRGSQGEPDSLFLLSVETGDRRRVSWPPGGSFGDSHPAFSPDGKAIAFARQISGGVEELCISDIAGGEPRQLTFDNRRIYSLDWSTDSRRIIFSSDRGGSYQLWSISVSGGTPERVAAAGGEAYDLSVARDTSRLAYTDRYSDSNIWRLEARQPGPRPSTARTSEPSKLITSSRGEDSPQFSPDGKQIVFASNRSGSWEIWACEADGANPVQLTSFGVSITGSPRYSPDGQKIAFDSRPGGQADIFVVSAGGGRPRQLTIEDSTDVLPSWSRDGQSIYFSSNRGGDRQIWKMSSDGGQATQITRFGGFEAFESADGRFLYYTKERDVAGIWRLPVEGGEETLLPEMNGVRLYRYWVLSQSGIYFVPEMSALRPAISFFSFDTGKVTQVAVAAKPMIYGPAGLAVSLDGRWILFAQEDQTSSDIMLVSNFD